MKIGFEFFRPVEKCGITPEIGGALISAGASILNGLGGIFGQKSANQKNYQQQLSLLQNQQNFAREMWQLQTSENRNSIINQMSQYKQLGINPLAVTGGVQQTNQSAPSAPSAPQSNYRNPLEGAQLAVVLSEAMKNFAEAKRTEAETPKLESETAYTWSLQKTEEALRAHRIDMLGIEIALGDAKINLTKKEVDEIDGRLSMMVKQKEQIDASIRNESLLAYDDYIRSVDGWINHRALEQHWSVQERQEWRNLAIQSYEAQTMAKDVASLIAQRGVQNEEIRVRIDNLKKESKLKDLQIDYETGTLKYKIQAGNMEYYASVNASKESALEDALTYEWIRNNPSTYMTSHGIQAVLSPLNGLLQMVGLGYGISRMGKTPKAPVPVKGFSR